MDRRVYFILLDLASVAEIAHHSVAEVTRTRDQIVLIIVVIEISPHSSAPASRWLAWFSCSVRTLDTLLFSILLVVLVHYQILRLWLNLPSQLLLLCYWPPIPRCGPRIIRSDFVIYILHLHYYKKIEECFWLIDKDSISAFIINK